MSRRRRIILAIIIGLASTVMSYLLLKWRGYGAGDFTWPLGGASALLHGINPYTNPKFGPGKTYPYGDLLFYPLPAVLVALPFTALPRYLAGALFYGIGSGLLGYAITRDGYARLPIFLSAPFFVGAYVAQWSPLITAAAILPWLLPLAFAKPNMGLAIGVAYPNVRAFIATAVIFALSLIVMPSWPKLWLHNLSGTHHPSPILILPGILLLAAAIAWRRPAGRLLLFMAIVPQLTFFYDQLPLWLIPKTWRQSMVLSISSWVAYGGWAWFHWNDKMMAQVFYAGPWIVAFIYMSALGLVLWQERQLTAEERAVAGPLGTLFGKRRSAQGEGRLSLAHWIKQGPDRLLKGGRNWTSR
jgi:hypothetical protein